MSVSVQQCLENESVVGAICYAYSVDSYSPTYLTRGDKIFEINPKEDISISINETIDMKLQYSNSNFTAAQWAAGNMKVGALYKAFSGAASMAVETTGESKIETVRVDAIGVCTKNCITSRGSFRTCPEKFLTESFKSSVQELTVEEIESRIGVFYAIRLQLGGMVKRSYVMEATEDDNESKVTAELQAAFGAECLGASIEAASTFETGRRSSNRNAKVRREWRAQGGDIDLWFQLGNSGADQPESSSAMDIATEWAQTIDGTNVYPFDFELRPLWELIKIINSQKATEFRLYLEDKWEKDESRHLPTMFLPTKLKVFQLPEASKTFIINTCKAHKSVLVEECTKAQSFLDSPMHFMDKKGNKKWKEAAESGQEEVMEVRDLVSNDPDITVEELIEKLEFKSHHRYAESHRYLGLWGNDSKHTNKVEKLNKMFLDKVIKRLNIDLNRQVAVEEWHDDLDECQLQVYEATEWFNDNLGCMNTEDKVKNVNRAIEQVKNIQESLDGFLERLATEVQG